MKLENFREEYLREIFRLYEEHCGIGREYDDAMHQRLSSGLENLKQYRYVEHRIGSRWEPHSKLCIETDLEGNVTVDFNSNFHPDYRQGNRFEEAEKSGEAFVNAAMQYISSQ